MNQIRIGNITIEYAVRKTPQSKRMRINVTPGKVEVVVPDDCNDDKIEAFVHRRRHWIFEKVDEVEEAAKRMRVDQPTHYRSGAMIPFWDRRRSLHVVRKEVDEITIEFKHRFHITIPENLENPDKAIKRSLEQWMKKRLLEESKTFAARYAKKTGLHPKNVRVKEQKHLWGSLSKDGIINVNWHLIFAPKQVLEYVVAHEICHLKYRNHSKPFWELLGSVFRNWNECKTWLEKNEKVWEVRAEPDNRSGTL
jgi:predicted metal-dependent hydrolase